MLNCLHDVVSEFLQLAVDCAFGKELQIKRTVEAPEVSVERFVFRDNTTNYNPSNIFARARLVQTSHVDECSSMIQRYSPIFKTNG